MPREILVNWTTPSGSDHRTVMYFNEGVAVSVQRAALQTLLTAVKASLSNQVSYLIQTSGRELDSTTGTLTGAWSETTASSGTGTVASQPVADTTQILFQWLTQTVVNGRFLRGRSFVPGLYVGGLSGGNLLAAQVTGLAAVADTFAKSAATPVVWHRPVQGAGGQQVQMTSGTVWSELAVLRRRR